MNSIRELVSPQITEPKDNSIEAIYAQVNNFTNDRFYRSFALAEIRGQIEDITITDANIDLNNPRINSDTRQQAIVYLRELDTALENARATFGFRFNEMHRLLIPHYPVRSTSTNDEWIKQSEKWAKTSSTDPGGINFLRRFSSKFDHPNVLDRVAQEEPSFPKLGKHAADIWVATHSVLVDYMQYELYRIGRIDIPQNNDPMEFLQEFGEKFLPASYSLD